MTDRERYRRTDRTQDVGFCFGALSATHLPGPALVLLLGELGLTPSAARNTLAKMVRQHALVSEPIGRSSLYSFSPETLKKYRQIEGTERPPAWSGEFRTVVYHTPERSRWFRDRLRYFAEFCGLGMLRPGVLIGVRDARDVIGHLLTDVPADVWIHHGALRPDSIDDARIIVGRAFDLAALRRDDERIRTAVARELRHPGVPDDDQGRWDLFRRWNRLYRDVTEFHMRDPHLPPEILPVDWSANDHMAALDTLNASWGPPLADFLQAQVARVVPAGHARYYPRVWSNTAG